MIAKHGYTVDWGYFHGTCFGSENAPLELERTLTDKIIADLRTRAVGLDELAADILAGKVEVQFYKRDVYDRATGKMKRVPCKREELGFGDATAEQQIKGAAYNAESEARHCRSHATMLEKLIDQRHGQPLIPVGPEKRQLAVGDKINKWGHVYEVTEIRYQVASGCGPYLNGKSMLHAVLQRADGRRTAIPVRSIRTSSIIAN